jgi:2-polyprenyl-3-methyl-5-hydroxy-6-metoxy-1,4-benzoquinol methylase
LAVIYLKSTKAYFLPTKYFMKNKLMYNKYKHLGREEIISLIDEVILEYKYYPVDLLHSDNAAGEFSYLSNPVSKAYYIRTIEDIVMYTSSYPEKKIKVLEIGAFLGLVSICLSRLGYEVVATDIPEFVSNENLQLKLSKYKIDFFMSNLRSYSLSCSNDEFDIIIMCEVLEHLNFNPLPLFKEINRVMKHNGLFYLSLPNIASLKNRIQLMKGRSIHNPVSHYFSQLKAGNTMIVGLHWREYTDYEIREMLEELGFNIKKQFYFDYLDYAKINDRKRTFSRLKFIFKKILYKFQPNLKENQTSLAIKVKSCDKEFVFTDATEYTKNV